MTAYCEGTPAQERVNQVNEQPTRRPICTECGALSARWYQPMIGTEHFCSIRCATVYTAAHKHSGETALAIHTDDCRHFTPEGQTAEELAATPATHTTAICTGSGQKTNERVTTAGIARCPVCKRTRQALGTTLARHYGPPASAITYCRCGHTQAAHNDGGNCWPRVGVTCLCVEFRETRSNMAQR